MREKIVTTYQDLEKLKYYLKQKNIDIMEIEYNEDVNVFIDISKEKLKKLQSSIKDLNFEIKEINLIEEKYIENK